MPPLTDPDLMRLVGFGIDPDSPDVNEQIRTSDEIIARLRKAIRLVPTSVVTNSHASDWPLFAIAVLQACHHVPNFQSTGWYVHRRAVERTIVQLLGILRPGFDRAEYAMWIVNRAMARHWLEPQPSDDDDEPQEIRITLLGERTLGGLIEPPAKSANPIDRMKAFRRAFMKYVSLAREQNWDGELNYTDFEAMQDAWVEVSDIVDPTWLHDVDAIESAVLESRPNNPHDIWNNAERQISQLILALGKEDRLQRARAEAFTADLHSIVPTSTGSPARSDPTAATATAIDPTQIEYIGRDAAAALCGVTKQTLEKWMADDDNPPEPVRPGGGGKRHEYDYQAMRPWLERRSGRKLPEHYAANNR